MKKGKTVLEMMQEQEPLNNYETAELCELYCNDGPMPCESEFQCSWIELFTKLRFIEDAEVEQLLEKLKRSLYDNLMPDFSGKAQAGIEKAFASVLKNTSHEAEAKQ